MRPNQTGWQGRLLAAAAGIVWLAATAGPTLAQPAPQPTAGQPDDTPFSRPPTIVVGTDPDGVVTHLELQVLLPGQQQPDAAGREVAAPGPAGQAPAEPVCAVTPMAGAPTGAGPPPPGSAYGYVQCADDPYGFTVLPLAAEANRSLLQLPAITVDPEALARSVRDRLPVPAVAIQAVPARALVGADTAFWLANPDGSPYQGAPLTQTTSLAGVTVEVQATPTSYTWDFGDATPTGRLVTASTGDPDPDASAIRHTYQRATPDVPVTCTFAYTVRWRQPGLTGWSELPPITRSATTTLPVAQATGALTR